MANYHDTRYKKLFKNPVFVQRLLEGFVDESFVKDLDFSTFSLLDKSFITDEFLNRESDHICKVSFQNKTMYLFILMEFQSTVDHFMAVRFLRYICEFYQYLIDSKQVSKKLPAVFPILLYNGESKWTADVQFSNLIEQTVSSRFIPKFEYFKIAENEFSDESLLTIKNVVSALFFVENHEIDKLKDHIDSLVVLLKKEDLSVINLFSTWINDYLGNRTDRQEIMHPIKSITEVKSMLAASLERYEKKLLKEGREEGREEALDMSILNMKGKGLSASKIADLLNISKERVEKTLKKQK